MKTIPIYLSVIAVALSLAGCADKKNDSADANAPARVVAPSPLTPEDADAATKRVQDTPGLTAAQKAQAAATIRAQVAGGK